MKKTLAFFSLFGSMSTLICCALPALFVSLGAGAVFVGLLTRFPQLIWVSEHKSAIFSVAGTLLLFGGIAQWQGRNEPCPLDEKKADACRSARRVSLITYLISVLIFLTGAGFSLLPELLNR
jgi:hypothetical protein